jgi:hypothetical protein
MTWRILSGGAIAALAGAAMLAAASGPSDAFTLNSPSLEAPVAAADIQQVWWHGGWHRWGWGWHRPVYGFYGGRHCWIGRWGYRHCTWW